MSFSIDQRESQRKPGEMQARDECGLYQFEIRSQAETAVIMGCTRQRIQQLERSALVKLRRAFESDWKELKEELKPGASFGFKTLPKKVTY